MLQRHCPAKRNNGILKVTMPHTKRGLPLVAGQNSRLMLSLPIVDFCKIHCTSEAVDCLAD